MRKFYRYYDMKYFYKCKKYYLPSTGLQEEPKDIFLI